jgi:hypothetical protein
LNQSQKNLPVTKRQLEFWDTPDTTDYPDAFQTVDVETAFRGRYYKIEIEADVAEVLQAHARQKGVTVSNLASDLLRQQLGTPRNHNPDFA